MDDSDSFFVDSTGTAISGGETFKCDFHEVESKNETSGIPDVVGTDKSLFCPWRFVKNLKQNDSIKVNNREYFVNYKLKTLDYFARVYLREDKDDNTVTDQRHGSKDFKRQAWRKDNKV